MAAKKDNLPLSLRKEDDSTGTITYANEVIAIIAGVAANEVEGIAGMCTSGGITEVFGRNRNITKGVKVEIGSEEASVDLFVIVEYGTPIQTAALNVQENVRKAIETMTGLHVVRIDVHVQGVSFEKENKELQAGLDSAELGKVTAAPDAALPVEPDVESAAAREPVAQLKPVVIVEDTPDSEPEEDSESDAPVEPQDPIKTEAEPDEPATAEEDEPSAETQTEADTHA